MSGEVCMDGRFELIAKYRQKLIEGTNIESAPDEMAVIDDIMFRCWQMGWLDKLEESAARVRCRDCRWYCKGRCDWLELETEEDFFCADGQEKVGNLSDGFCDTVEPVEHR